MKYTEETAFPVTVRRIESVNSLQNRPSQYSQANSHSPRNSRAIQLACYLYINAHYRLEDGQKEFIAHFQSRLNLAEIQKALEFVHVLTTNPRTRARMQITAKEISLDGTIKVVPLIAGKPVRSGVPRPKLREQRRIGVGYRDKGSLRESHRPVLPVEVTLSHEVYALFKESQVPQWILRGERKSQSEVMSDWRKNPSWEKLPENHLLGSEEDWSALVLRSTGAVLRPPHAPENDS